MNELLDQCLGYSFFTVTLYFFVIMKERVCIGICNCYIVLRSLADYLFNFLFSVISICQYSSVFHRQSLRGTQLQGQREHHVLI